MISRILVAGLCLATLGIGVGGCERESQTIEFMLPNDFQGLIYVKQQAGAAEMPKTPTGYKIVIPESGVVVYENTEAFARWHAEIAQYENGRWIPNYSSTDGGLDQICFYSHSRDSEGVNRFLVGPRRIVKSGIDRPSWVIDHPPGRVEWPRATATSRAAE
jgi:hypothetical protein